MTRKLNVTRCLTRLSSDAYRPRAASAPAAAPTASPAPAAAHRMSRGSAARHAALAAHAYFDIDKEGRLDTR